MKSIQELYDETEDIINFDINDLFCFFLDNMNFDEAMRDTRWRQAMEEEINSIKKNNT